MMCEETSRYIISSDNDKTRVSKVTNQSVEKMHELVGKDKRTFDKLLKGDGKTTHNLNKK